MNYRWNRLQAYLHNLRGRLAYRLLGTTWLSEERRAALRATSTDPNPLILFVCTGNICRSSYAEYRLRALLGTGAKHFEVASAGISTTPGKPADAQAISIARLRGIDLDPHRTQSTSQELLNRAAIIFAMHPTHLHAIRNLSPELNSGLLLGELGLKHGDPLIIDDPYGAADQVFEACFDQIDRSLEELVAVLNALCVSQHDEE